MRFERIKQIEDEVLAFTLEGVKTHVICAGLLYGSGEDALEQFFRAAWLQDPELLPIPGDGTNLVPAIHVNDLATFTLKIADSPPEHRYHFAFDGNKDRTLGSLIQSISKSVGSGKVENVERTDLVKKEHEYLFNINFWSLASELLLAPPPPPAPEDTTKQGNNDDGEPAAPPEEPPAPEDPEFEWHSKRGIAEKGKEILAEFSKTHNLRQLSIFVQGEPNSKKEKFSEVLANHYNIPLIKLNDITSYVEQFCQDEELLLDLKEEKDNIAALIEQKKYNIGLTSETGKVLYRCLKFRLSQNDCFNRGYIFEDPVLGEKDLEVLFGLVSKSKLKRKRPKPPKKKKGKKAEVDEAQPDNAQGNTQPEKTAEHADGDEGGAEEQGDEGVEELAAGDENPEGGADGDQAQEGEEEEKDEGEEEEKEEEQPPEDDDNPDAPKYERFLPESFIFFEEDRPDFQFSTDKEDPRKEELMSYCDKMKIEYLSINITQATLYEGLEDLRLYIERVESLNLEQKTEQLPPRVSVAQTKT